MRRTFYWIATGLVAVELLAGGVADLARANWAAEVLRTLGYPPYLMTLLGFWKVLAALALVYPRWPAVTEWAYAGTFFELTGAAASYLLSGAAFSGAIAPAAFTVLTLVSWRLWKRAGAVRPAAGRFSSEG